MNKKISNSTLVIKNFILKWNKLIITILLLVFLFLNINIKETFNIFLSVDPMMVVIVFCALLLLFIIGACNIWILLNVYLTISFFSFLKIYIYSWALSLITPGQVGDASMIVFLKKKNLPISQASIVYMIDKCITLFLFSWIALYGMIKYLSFDINKLGLIIIFSSLLIFIILKNSHTINFFRIFKNFKKDFIKMKSNRMALFKNIIGTCVKWGVLTFTYYSAFMAFNVNLSWSHASVIPIMATLIGYIPISIAGIGTVELSAVYLFSTLDISQSVVVGSYILLRLLQFFIAFITLFIPSFINKLR